jgi:hypothetical protein
MMSRERKGVKQQVNVDAAVDAVDGVGNWQIQNRKRHVHAKARDWDALAVINYSFKAAESGKWKVVPSVDRTAGQGQGHDEFRK